MISRLQRKWFLTPHSLVGAPHPFCRSEIYRWGQLTAPGFATGPFILLGAGALVAALLALIECCCIANARRKRSRKQSSNSVANKKPKGQVSKIEFLRQSFHASLVYRLQGNDTYDMRLSELLDWTFNHWLKSARRLYLQLKPCLHFLLKYVKLWRVCYLSRKRAKSEIFDKNGGSCSYPEYLSLFQEDLYIK